MRHLRVTLREPPERQHPMHEFLRESDAVHAIQMLYWNLSNDGLSVALFYVEGDREAYVAALESVAAVREFSVSTIDDRSFYVHLTHEVREDDRRFFAAFEETNVVVAPPVEHLPTGETKYTLVGDAEDLQRVLDDLPEGIDVSVDRIGDYDSRRSTLASTLTDRQREAVTVAVEVGYYATPRTGSVEDVAEELDCAPSTASEHLRKAETRVMLALVGS